MSASLRNLIGKKSYTSHQVAASSEQLTVNAQQSASNEEIAAASQALAQLAVEMQEAIDKFKT